MKSKYGRHCGWEQVTANFPFPNRLTIYGVRVVLNFILIIIVRGEEVSAAHKSVASDLEGRAFVTPNGDNPPLPQLFTARKGMES